MKNFLRYTFSLLCIFLFSEKIAAQNDSIIVKNDSLVALKDTIIHQKDSLLQEQSDVLQAITSPVDTVHISLDSLEMMPFVVNDSNGCLPFTVVFSYFRKDEGIKYKWDFGDGEISYQKSPQHTYLKSGVYTIRQVSYFAKDSLVVEKHAFIHVYEGASPSFISPKTCFCLLPAKASFVNISKSAATYHWLFPGGEPASFEGFSPPEIVYKQAGNYPVTLISETQGACKDTLTLESFLKVSKGVNFSAIGTSAACPPLAVTFKDSTLGCATAWEWDFGDGKVKSHFKDPIHIYNFSGDYSVKLTVSFEGGCKDSLIKSDFIHLAKPNVEYKVVNPLVCLGEKVQMIFNLKGYILLEPESEVLKVLSSKNRNDVTNFYYQYPKSGNFVPQMTFVDTSGCIIKIPFQDTISVYPKAKTTFTIEPNYGVSPLTTKILLNESSDNIFTYTTWQILKNKDLITSSEEKHPTFILEKPGRYDIRFIGENQWGCRDTSVREQTIAVSEGTFLEQTQPVATFTNVPDDGGLINIQLLSANPGEFLLTILDATGTQVYQETIQSLGGTKIIRYSTASLPAGNYEAVLSAVANEWQQKVSFSKK